MMQSLLIAPMFMHDINILHFLYRHLESFAPLFLDSIHNLICVFFIFIYGLRGINVQNVFCVRQNEWEIGNVWEWKIWDKLFKNGTEGRD